MLGDIHELAVRYVDGALNREEAQAFEILADANPDVQALVEEHRQLRAMLREAYGPPPGEADLGAIHALLAAGDVTKAPAGDKGKAPADDAAKAPAAGRAVPLARRWPAAQPVLRGPRLGWYSAIAASLALGIALGQMAGGKAGPRLVEERQGQLVAAGQLDTALSGQLAGQKTDAGVQIGLSFRTASGLCRTFTADSGMAGLACHRAGRWAIEATARQSPPAQQGAYRLAAGSVPAGIMAQVDDTIVGAPLSPAEESRARSNGW